MGTVNKTYEIITKEIFGGSVGKHIDLLRKMIEINEFEISGVVPNGAQTTYIDATRIEYETYDAQIRTLEGETKLTDMV